jgi:hypothetical protein
LCRGALGDAGPDIDIKDLQFVFGRIGSTCASPVPDTQGPIPAESLGSP